MSVQLHGVDNPIRIAILADAPAKLLFKFQQTNGQHNYVGTKSERLGAAYLDIITHLSSCNEN
jgi:hypothetical protein